MEVIILRQFAKDLQKLKSTDLNQLVLETIEEVETVGSVREIKNIKKMKGFKSFYRIRVGNYRLGCIVEGNSIEFMRIAHRKEIYAIFP